MSRLRFFAPGSFSDWPFLARGGCLGLLLGAGLQISLSVSQCAASWLPPSRGAGKISGGGLYSSSGMGRILSFMCLTPLNRHASKTPF